MRCVVCGRLIPNDRKKTCSRECFREHQKRYNLVYGRVYRELRK